MPHSAILASTGLPGAPLRKPYRALHWLCNRCRHDRSRSEIRTDWRSRTTFTIAQTQRPVLRNPACRPTIAFLKSNRPDDPMADERLGDEAIARVGRAGTRG